MKMTKQIDDFYYSMLKKYGDILTEITIIQQIEENEDITSCEQAIKKIYDEELVFNEIWGIV